MTEQAELVSFQRWVRHALVHLYDPNELRKSQLLQLFHIPGAEGASRLRKILMDAIEALKPAEGISQQSQAWRTYRTITHRFVEQFTQNEVAINMGISIRQMRRQERLALEVLSDYLIKQYHLQLPGLMPGLKEDEEEPTEAQEPLSSREQELEWLEKDLPIEPVDLSEFFQSLLATIQPMMEQFKTYVVCDIQPGAPRPMVHHTSFRQTWMTLLSMAIATGGRTVQLKLETMPSKVSIQIWVETEHEAGRLKEKEWDPENLEMLKSLVQLSNGTIETSQDNPGYHFWSAITYPIEVLSTVLVIDDNKDTLQLYQRYLLGSPYEFVGVNDPSEALDAAARFEPQVIVLDVMMPGIDGWEMLGRLRTHPKTQSIPVVVCSILPQEQVAITLGAAAFLRKPVSRKMLLSILDRFNPQPANRPS